MSRRFYRFALPLAVAVAVLVNGLVALDADNGVKLNREIKELAPVIHYVYYRDFGAKGDGKTDDFNAIVAAHAYANANNAPTNKCVVKADPDATYYIGDANKTKEAIVRTDTDWGDAKFIIDGIGHSANLPNQACNNRNISGRMTHEYLD